MFNNIKMKLLIGGKSRNIYMRKDGSAYYKSGGQQVDVTYMFKKNGGGLKKQYIKGGVVPEGGVDPEASTFDANKVFQNISPQTKTKGAPAPPGAPPGAATEGAPRRRRELRELKPLRPATATAIPEGAAAAVAPSAAQSAAQQKLADEVPPPATATAAATVDAVPLLAKEAATTIPEGAAAALADTPPPKAETGSGTELEVLTDITALDNFPSNDNKEKFLKAFFDLAQLVISVTNNLHKKPDSKIEIKTPNPETAEKQVTKLNGIINFILKSKVIFTSNLSTREGIFSEKYNFKKDYSKYQEEFLSLLRDKDGGKINIKKTSLLTLKKISMIFDTIGIVASYWLVDDKINKIYEQIITDICNNINSFLKNESKLKQIRVT